MSDSGVLDGFCPDTQDNPKKTPAHMARRLFPLLLLALCALYFLRWHRLEWRGAQPIRSRWDQQAYFAYLPALLLERDITLLSQMPHIEENRLHPGLFRPGYAFNPVSMGVAVLEAPFFMVGHGVAWLGGWPLTGWSGPYQHAVALGNLFYAWMSLVLLFRLLGRYHHSTAALWTVGLLACGSSWLGYAVLEPGMSHVHTMFLMTLFLNCLDGDACRHSQSWAKYALAGLAGGLIALVRASSLPIVLFIFLTSQKTGTGGWRGQLLFWQSVKRHRPVDRFMRQRPVD